MRKTLLRRAWPRAPRSRALRAAAGAAAALFLALSAPLTLATLPAEDMMQAFAWRFLVPAEAFTAYLLPGPGKWHCQKFHESMKTGIGRRERAMRADNE